MKPIELSALNATGSQDKSKTSKVLLLQMRRTNWTSSSIGCPVPESVTGITERNLTLSRTRSSRLYT